jgi:hypothetical protein
MSLHMTATRRLDDQRRLEVTALKVGLGALLQLGAMADRIMADLQNRSRHAGCMVGVGQLPRVCDRPCGTAEATSSGSL